MAAQKTSSRSKSRRGPRRPWATRLAAVLILLAALPILGSGLHFAKVEFDAFGAQQAMQRFYVGRVLDEGEEARMRAQLLKAAGARPTRARMEWASSTIGLAEDQSAVELEATMVYLRHRLARNPASHPAWARLTRLEKQQGHKSVSAQLYKVAYDTGAYMPSSAIWAIAMGQRNWLYLDGETQANVQRLTYDLFSFNPAATSTIAGPKWRELYIRAALAHEPEKVRLFERYLTLYFDPAYNR